MFEKAIEYTLMIKSWDDLVDPQTLAFYITLVLTRLLTSYAASTLKEKIVSIELVSIDPLAYTWIFFFQVFSSCRNDDQVQQGYVCKDEVQEGRATVQHQKEWSPSVTSVASATPIVSDVKTARTVSSTTSIEEIPTPSKRPHLTVKEKEKADSRSSTVWDDEGLAVERAHRVVTTEDLKFFSDVPFNAVAYQHVHKLIQVKCLCIF